MSVHITEYNYCGTEYNTAVADPEIVGGGGCGRSRAAEGREGVGRGTPSPRGRGLIFFNFGPQNGQFRCTVGAGGGDASPSSSPWIRHCTVLLEQLDF